MRCEGCEGPDLMALFEQCVGIFERASGRPATAEDLSTMGVRSVAAHYLGRDPSDADVAEFATGWLQIRGVLDT